VRVIVLNTGHTWGSVNPGYLTQLQILPTNKTTRPDVCTSHAYYHCRISENLGPDVITYPYFHSLWEWRNSIFDVLANWRWRYLCHRAWFNDPLTNKSVDLGFLCSVIAAIKTTFLVEFLIDRILNLVNSSGEEKWVMDLLHNINNIERTIFSEIQGHLLSRSELRWGLWLFLMSKGLWTHFVNILVNYYCTARHITCPFRAFVSNSFLSQFA
jgi:hypothetical protein